MNSKLETVVWSMCILGVGALGFDVYDAFFVQPETKNFVTGIFVLLLCVETTFEMLEEMLNND